MSAVYENHLDLLYSVGGTSKITWLTVPVTSWSAPNILVYSWNQMQFYNLRIQDEHGGGGQLSSLSCLHDLGWLLHMTAL